MLKTTLAFFIDPINRLEFARTSYYIRYMSAEINQPVSINLFIDSAGKRAKITHLIWNGRTYKIDELGLHYTYKSGLTFFHVFCVSSQNVNFKIELDTRSLLWNLKEVYDTLSD